MLRFFGIVGQRIAGVVIEGIWVLDISFQVVLLGSLVIKVKNVNSFSPLTSLHSMAHSNIFSEYTYNTDEYSRSSPCDHSLKRSVLVTTTFVKPRLNCDLNFVIKGSHVSDRSRTRARPLLRLPDWAFPLLLRWLDPVFLEGYHPTLKLSGIPTFTFIESYGRWSSTGKIKTIIKLKMNW